MHHRRSRTTRREVNRMDSKRFRAAEKAALDRPPSALPSDHWGRGPELPIPDVSSSGKVRGKKVTPKKSRCPLGGAHEWYREWVEEKDYKTECLDYCSTCEVQREKWRDERERWKRDYGWDYNKWDCPYRAWYCQLHGEKKWFTRRRKIATCINCWEVKIEKVTDNYYELFPTERRYRWRRYKPVLPKRPVKEIYDDSRPGV